MASMHVVLWARLVLTATCLTCTAQFAAGDTRSDWGAFRRQFPYHAQVIALGQPTADGSRTIIVSEPPPAVTLDDITTRYRGRVHSVKTFTNRLGYDGWVKDIAAVVVPGDEHALQSLVEDLSRDLFGTSYKAYAVDIAGASAETGPYDLSVSSVALRNWMGVQPAPRSAYASYTYGAAWLMGIGALVMLLRSKRRGAITILSAAIVIGYFTRQTTPQGPAGDLTPLHGGESTSVQQALEEPNPGVYLTESPGLVVLLLARDQPLNELSVPLREFALDSDLVLGAIGSSKAIAVVARERQVPVTSLPPLRVETLLQLAAAAANTEELAQSYERLNLFAGSTGETHRDWAPIFLSSELRDTEYGSLLNITDQLLKGWSEHGEIEYINFPYPKPRSFPFSKGLLETAGTGRVTYNWNTKGVGYADNTAGYEVVAFARTGALPVDYLGAREARMRTFEDQGYEYFAGTTGDPNLARVVQYAGMYQVWRHFSIKAEWQASARSHEGPEALLPMAAVALERIRDVDTERLALLAERTTNPDTKEAVKELLQVREVLEAITREGSSDTLDVVARALVRPRDMMMQTSLTEEQSSILGLAQTISRNPFVRYMLSDGNAHAARLYSSADSKDEPTGWIKTPSIVVSWQTGEKAGQAEGGHNLSSVVTRTVADESLSVGSIRVAEEGGTRILYYHPADATKIRGAVRSFARNAEQEASQLEQTVAAALRSAKADSLRMADALHLTTRPASLGRGLNSTNGVAVTRMEPWRYAGEIPASHVRAIAALDEPSVVPMIVERTTNGRYVVSRSNLQGAIEARDSAGAMDAIVDAARRDPKGGTVHLHFKGMNDDQARAFSQAGELHVGNGRPVKIRTSVEGGEEGSLRLLGELRDGKWDAGRATIRVVDEAPVARVSKVEFEIAVPERATSRSLLMRVEVSFRQGVRATSEFISRLSDTILSMLRELLAGSPDLDLLTASRQIMRTLRAQDESIANVKLRIRSQSGEIHVVRNVLASPDSLGE